MHGIQISYGSNKHGNGENTYLSKKEGGNLSFTCFHSPFSKDVLFFHGFLKLSPLNDQTGHSEPAHHEGWMVSGQEAVICWDPVP
jgi:hypothetical protein